MVNKACDNKTNWDKAVEFHGHECPGLAMGYRATELALEVLGSERSIDEELLAIVENNACGVDALQTLAGCSFGKGNLYYKDFGKSVYTIARRGDSNAVRVAVKYGTTFDPDFKSLKERSASAAATEQDRALYHEALQKRIKSILNAGTEMFDVRKVIIELPPPASIYQTLQCSICGEGVMEPRARLKDGRVVCIPCGEEI
ncbi:MAG: FmdE family protein [Desulfotomaculaceae bacterium]|nr:FmdE family protein [Desulfotomaculaceae bacterium]MDD4767192.1 FmdE family protein [Desulfotomaculaceae bacterium]